MIIKNHYQSKLTEMEIILKKYDFYRENFDDVQELRAIIEDYAFRVVMIGGFSSGKSALLNRLLGCQLLKENQGPETSVPAEIAWAPVESASAVLEDGSVKPLSLEGVSENPPKGAAFLSLRVNIPFLKARPELVLVDFPGFDSNIEAHNKAITNYVQRGSAFILLIPAKNGTMTESDRKFVKEVAHYPQGLACFISKADMVPPEQCEEIRLFVHKIISTLYGTNVPVETISIHEDVEARFEDKIANVVDAFNPQELFNSSLKAPLNAVLGKGIMALTQYMEAVQLDVHDIEMKISETKARKAELEQQLERERIALDRKYQMDIIPDIMDNLESALHNNVDTLLDAALAGQQNFVGAVQSIVRPILNSVPAQIQSNFRDMVTGMRFDFMSQSPENEQEFKNALLNVVDVVAKLPIFKQDGTKSDGQGIKLAGNMASSMGMVFTASKTINPILGVVLTLAPALIELFFSQKATQQHKMRDQARGQVGSQIIPAVLAKLENQVVPAVLEARDTMFAEIKARIDANLAAEVLALESAMKEKQERVEAHENDIAQVQQDLNALRHMILEECSDAC